MSRLLQSFMVGLGYDYDDAGLKEFELDVETVSAGVAKLAQVAIGGAAALTAIVVASTAASDEQGKLAAEVNTSVENIDALTFALERSGGTADGMTSSLRGIARRASEAQRGIGEGVEAFGLLGINVSDSNGQLKDSDQLLKEVASGMQGLRAGRQIELAEKLGITGSLRLLQQGRGEIEALTTQARNLGVTTEEDARIAAEFQDSLTNLWKIIKDVSRTVARELAPLMTTIINRFTDWWEVNRDLVNSRLEQWIRRIIAGAKVLAFVMAFLGGVAVLNGIAKLVVLFRALAIRIAAVKIAIFAIPLAIAIGVAAILLLLEDVYAFFNGKESVLGELVKDSPRAEAALISIGELFKDIFGTVGKILDGWKEIANLASKFSVENVKEQVKLAPKVFGLIKDDVVDFFGGGDDEPNGLVTPTPQRNAVINPRFRAIQNSRSSNVNNTFNITGTNAEEIAQATNEKFQQTMNDMETTVDQ